MRAKLYLLLFPFVVAGCGGGYDSSSPGGGSSCRSTVEVIISDAGVDPASIEVTGGTCVAFVNQDDVAHQPMSNDHPTHTLCPQLNGDVIAPGGRRVNPMRRAGTCGYHDHLTEDTEPKWRGTVIVTSDDTGGGGIDPYGY